MKNRSIGSDVIKRGHRRRRCSSRTILKSGPPGVWDRDPLQDATGASLLTPLPEALAGDDLLVRAWVGSSSRIGALLFAELNLAGIDPWDNQVRAWLSHVGVWNLARTGAGAVMHCWMDERDTGQPARLVSYIEALVQAVRARIIAYEGYGRLSSAPRHHAAAQQRLEELWSDYCMRQRSGEVVRLSKELVELAMRVARHEARRLRPNLPAHSDQADVQARAVLSVFDSIDHAWRAEHELLVPRIRRGVRCVVLDELHGEAHLTHEEQALLGIDSLKISLEDIEGDEEEVLDVGVVRPAEAAGSNPRWAPCDQLSNSSK